MGLLEYLLSMIPGSIGVVFLLGVACGVVITVAGFAVWRWMRG